MFTPSPVTSVFTPSAVVVFPLSDVNSVCSHKVLRLVFTLSAVVSVFTPNAVVSVYTPAAVVSVFTAAAVVSAFTLSAVVSVFTPATVVSVFTRAAVVSAFTLSAVVSVFTRAAVVVGKDATESVLLNLLVCGEDVNHGYRIDPKENEIAGVSEVTVTHT